MLEHKNIHKCTCHQDTTDYSSTTDFEMKKESYSSWMADETPDLEQLLTFQTVVSLKSHRECLATVKYLRRGRQ